MSRQRPNGSGLPHPQLPTNRHPGGLVARGQAATEAARPGRCWRAPRAAARAAAGRTALRGMPKS